MRGAHRGVWCSKGTPSMEAELFAAESKRPALDGRALLCAANHAREIQGLKAPPKLPDARNRAPVTPAFAAHLRCVSAKEGKGSLRGDRKPYLVSCPLLFPPVRTGVSAAEGGNFPESFIKALPEQRPCAPATESASRSFAARFLPRVPVRRSTAPPCARW